MKGVVFVELLSMAETVAGEDVVDDVLDSLDLETGGAYSSVGIYPCSELMKLVEAFSETLDTPADELQTLFGRWIFNKFAEGYPAFFKGKDNAFTMLESIENEVHVEVRKLYPEVELPSFETKQLDDDTMQMIYSSDRPLVAFCQGMIEACVQHFDRPAEVTRTLIERDGKFVADFRIKMTG